MGKGGADQKKPTSTAGERTALSEKPAGNGTEQAKQKR